MNLLVTYGGLDTAVSTMLERLSCHPDINIYIAVCEEEKGKVKGKCVPVIIPAIKSKVVREAIKSLRKIIKEHNIQVIFSPSSAGLSNALLASIGTKVKNIGYRGTQAKINRWDFTYYLGLLNPRVNHIFCLTQDIVEYLSGFINPNKLTLNPDPFEVEWMENACNHPKKVDGIPENAFKILHIGNTKGRPFKGLTQLIKAVRLLNNPNVHFTHIGNYEDSDYALAKEGEVGERIHFLGVRYDAIHYIPTHDLFVSPAIRDAAPRSVKESMGCGLPCIVTNIPGARDLVVDKVTALLVPSDSPEKLAEGIKWMMDHPEQRMAFGEAGRERIRTNFKMEKYLSTFEKKVRELAKQ